MKAYFPEFTIYKRLRRVPYKAFEICESEIEEIGKLGGFVTGEVDKSTAPVSSKPNLPYFKDGDKKLSKDEIDKVYNEFVDPKHKNPVPEKKKRGRPPKKKEGG